MEVCFLAQRGSGYYKKEALIFSLVSAVHLTLPRPSPYKGEGASQVLWSSIKRNGLAVVYSREAGHLALGTRERCQSEIDGEGQKMHPFI